MIEKLKEHDVIDPKTGNVIGTIGCDLREIMDKLNEVIDAANKHEDIIRQIGEWGTSKGECLWCENLTAVNLDDRMIGCTTLDIPKSYKNNQLTLATLDYSKKLEKENSDLKDELDRTHKALDRAKWWLHEIVESHRCTPISTAEMALKEITALEQKEQQ